MYIHIHTHTYTYAYIYIYIYIHIYVYILQLQLLRCYYTMFMRAYALCAYRPYGIMRTPSLPTNIITTIA